jgi:YjjG family noncanonical pyrimidine nucleotidase
LTAVSSVLKTLPDLKKYKHIFFDLDDTVWDYRSNASETVRELYGRHEMAAYNTFSEDDFCETFLIVNKELWDEFDRGRVNKSIIREKRFQLVMERLGQPDPALGIRLSEEFISICPTKGNLPPRAFEVLDYLSDTYVMHIITNGFEEVQHIKLRSGGLTGYFDQVIISDTIGKRKPDPGIFDHALQAAGAKRHESIMIGDNLNTDIKGARDSSIDQVFYNPLRLEHDRDVTYEVYEFSQLQDIL